MIYSIVVWGFDTDNDYQHDCDLIKAKSFKEAFNIVINYNWAGWTFTKIKIELMLNKTVKWLIIILSVLLLSFQFMILFEKTDNVLISILPLLMLVFAITFPAICFYIQSNSVVKEICKEFSCKKQ